jgi:hypothetical protein
MLIRTLKGFSIAFTSALKQTIQQIAFPNSMNKQEALNILNLKENFKGEELNSKFQSFYRANSKEMDGSPYIQEKIRMAYEYLKNKSLKN